MEKFIDNAVQWLSDFGITFIIAIAVLIGGLALVKLFVKLLKKAHGLRHLDDGVRQFIISFVKIALNIIVIFSAAIIMGFPAASIVTMLASAGVAIGLALQGSLSNLAGGLMLVIFKPFGIGDFITVNDYSGTVKSISVFYTTLSTADNKCITLPNGSVTNSAIVNATSNGTLRADITYSVSYKSSPDAVRCVLLQAAASDSKVLDEPAPDVVLTNTAESSLDFTLRVWCKSEDYWDVYYTLKERAKIMLDENGIEIPYPQLDVHIDK